ncbi:MAG: hypothetical protein WD077_08465 [Bacteroidia bacterium]
MKLAIHSGSSGFHPRWAEYCRQNNIAFKLVDCYASDIIHQIQDCDALMWHHSQGNPKDILIAKQILYALEHSGFRVFPDFRTAWHFDDKVAQKYLLEALGAPIVPSYVFVEKKTALAWAEETHFPKVFKLRGGAGSSNVRLARNRSEAFRLIKKAFGSGFSNYNALGNLMERWRKWRFGKTTITDVAKGIIRLGYKPPFAKIGGRERGYVYFQDFIPGNDSDIRVVVIGERAFALKRMVRQGDFRASGSGEIQYERDLFDLATVALSFKITKDMAAQCVAFDYVYTSEAKPLLVEISYGFAPGAYDTCPGYWDSELRWHNDKFNPQGWMVDLLLRAVNEDKRD